MVISYQYMVDIVSVFGRYLLVFCPSGAAVRAAARGGVGGGVWGSPGPDRGEEALPETGGDGENANPSAGLA